MFYYHLEWLLIPSVGFLIGYSTNWLAIKMIFRPYKVKKIGKFRIPFTPGILFQKKKDFTERFSKTLTTYLLNSNFFLEYLEINFLKKNQIIANYLEIHLNKISNQSIYNIIPKIWQNSFKIYYEKLKLNIFGLLKNDQFLIQNFYEIKIHISKKDLSKIRKIIEIIIEYSLEKFLIPSNQKFFNIPNLQKKSINDFLSDSIYLNVEALTKKNWSLFIKRLKELVYQNSLDKTLEKIIENSIKKYLKSQLGQTEKWISRIWNIENQVDKLASQISTLFIEDFFAYIEIEENKNHIISKTLNYIRNTFDQPIRNLGLSMDNPKVSLILNESIDKTIKNLINNINKKDLSIIFIKKILKASKKKKKSKKIIKWFIKNIQESFFYNNFLESIEMKCNDFVFSKPIKDYAYFFFKEDLSNEEIKNKLILNWINKGSHGIFNFIKANDILNKFEKNLQDHIFKTLHQFDMKDIEKILLGIIKNELQWINILGGILGFLISISQLIILWLIL